MRSNSFWRRRYRETLIGRVKTEIIKQKMSIKISLTEIIGKKNSYLGTVTWDRCRKKFLTKKLKRRSKKFWNKETNVAMTKEYKKTGNYKNGSAKICRNAVCNNSSCDRNLQKTTLTVYNVQKSSLKGCNL